MLQVCFDASFLESPNHRKGDVLLWYTVLILIRRERTLVFPEGVTFGTWGVYFSSHEISGRKEILLFRNHGWLFRCVLFTVQQRQKLTSVLPSFACWAVYIVSYLKIMRRLRLKHDWGWNNRGWCHILCKCGRQRHCNLSKHKVQEVGHLHSLIKWNEELMNSNTARVAVTQGKAIYCTAGISEEHIKAPQRFRFQARGEVLCQNLLASSFATYRKDACADPQLRLPMRSENIKFFFFSITGWKRLTPRVVWLKKVTLYRVCLLKVETETCTEAFFDRGVGLRSGATTRQRTKDRLTCGTHRAEKPLRQAFFAAESVFLQLVDETAMWLVIVGGLLALAGNLSVLFVNWTLMRSQRFSVNLPASSPWSGRRPSISIGFIGSVDSGIVSRKSLFSLWSLQFKQEKTC